MGRAFRAGAVLAVVGLAALANGQGYFGGDETVCHASNNYKYLGCFPGNIAGGSSNYPFSPGAYVPGQDPSAAFPGWDPGSHYNNTVAPYTCQKACRGHGFKYIALNNGVCYCGMLPPTIAATGTHCDHYCGADESQTCGGGSDTEIYVDPSFADPNAITTAGAATMRSYYQYLGCYYSPAFNTQNTNVANTCQLTTDACYEHCAAAGYPPGTAIWNDPADSGSVCGLVKPLTPALSSPPLKDRRG